MCEISVFSCTTCNGLDFGIASAGSATQTSVYNAQKRLTANGTVKSTSIPCRTAIKTKSLPEYLVMTGRVVSIVVAPPAQIGARGPKNRTHKGAPKSAIISRIILVIKAIVPSSAADCTPNETDFRSVIITDDKE